MPTDVIMPQMGESIIEGTITKWLKKPGDRVEKDEPLFEISTDKVDAEIPSPTAGILSEIKIPEGATVGINTVVAVIGGFSASSCPPHASRNRHCPCPRWASPSWRHHHQMAQEGRRPNRERRAALRNLHRQGRRRDPSPVAGILTEIKTPEGATVEINTVVAVIGGAIGVATPAAKEASKATAAPSAENAASVSVPSPVVHTGRPIRSSPLVRRIAKENKLDLNRIPGTGSNGRITREDVLRHLSQYGPGSSSVAAATQPPPPPLSGDLVPMTRMRAIIAQRMVESVRTSPHVHTVYKVDMTRIVRLREREKAAFQQRNGFNLTYMPFIATAAIEALRRFPIRQCIASRHVNPIPPEHPSRHRGGPRVGPHRARNSPGRAAQLRRSGPHPRRPRPSRPHQEAPPRRNLRFHLHPHQRRSLLAASSAHPSSISPSRPSSLSAASARSPSSLPTLKATTPSPSAPCSCTASASTTASSTAPTLESSC